MRRLLQAPVVCSLLLLAFTASASKPLWAHAILMQSRPAGSSSVRGPDVPIWLRFNVRVDGKRSRVSVTAPDGAVTAVTDLKQTAPDTIESQITGLKPGVYKLHWQVLASDGHISRGDVDFTVN